MLRKITKIFEECEQSRNRGRLRVRGNEKERKDMFGRGIFAVETEDMYHECGVCKEVLLPTYCMAKGDKQNADRHI